jgi:hypothetical protein
MDDKDHRVRRGDFLGASAMALALSASLRGAHDDLTTQQVPR